MEHEILNTGKRETKDKTNETTALQGKSHLCTPFLGIARPQSQFPLHVSVSDLYIPRISPHISLQQNRQTDPRNI
jgi:hypothetical protein